MRLQVAIVALAGFVLAAPAMAADLATPKSVVRLASPAPAASNLSGDVSFFGGAVSGDGWSESIFGGEGRAGLALSNSFTLQGDAGGRTIFSNGYGLSGYEVTGHFYKANAGGALGLKAGVLQLPTPSMVGMNLGAEGQIFLGNLTLGAEINNSWFSAYGGRQLLQLRGLARFYPSPNTRVQLDLSWWRDPPPLLFDIAWAVAGSLTQRLAGTPVDLNAGIRYDRVDNIPALSGKLGLTVNFDKPGSTKLSHDRNNVVFDKLSAPLPNYYYNNC